MSGTDTYTSTLENTRSPSYSTNDVVRFTGFQKNKRSGFGLTDDQMSQMVAITGASGTGKTQIMLQMMTQVKSQLTQNDSLICFDPKGDYVKALGGPCDFMIGSTKGVNAKTVHWNVFTESTYGNNDIEGTSAIIREITKTLFAERLLHTTNIYFPNSAREILHASILQQIIEANLTRDYTVLSNKGLKEYINSFDSIEKWRSLAATLRKYKLSQAATHLETREAPSIISELSSLIGDIFVDQFGKKGSFSIRKFTRERGGKTVFIEYALDKGETLKPVYSLLMDLAMADAMTHPRKDGKVYIFLDEMRLANFVSKIDDAAAFGRSQGIRLICGIQSVTSLRQAFGEKADSILSNISNLIVLKTNDKPSRDMIKERCGEELVKHIWDWEDNRHHEQLLMGHVVEDWQLANLQIGDAIVQLSGNQPFLFHFDPYSNK